MRGYGGVITECEPSTSSREEVFARVQAETGADFVHPYNDERVIAGQGTCSKEIIEDLGELDAVVAPIGGGGMISGTCLTLSNIAPKTKIYAAEPEQADDAYQSFKQGKIVAYDAPDTVADGLKVPLKERTWHFVSTYVTDVLTRLRAGDRRRDAADLGAHEDRDGAELGGAARHHPEEPRHLRRQARRRHHHRRQRRPRQAALAQVKGGDPMTKHENIAELEVGYDIPAAIGMAYEDIQTPCLILDLDALERNVKKMGDYARAHNMRHRAHGKMHKSVDVLKLQMEQGGAIGVCCQKVSEAEVFARAGIKDILVSNEVRDPAKIDLLARMPKHGGRVIVCVDDVANVADLSKAAQKHGTTLDVFVEIDCGAGRCGVTTTEAVVEIAKAVAAAPGLRFLGIQAYQGAMQHLDNYEDRKAKLDAAIAQVEDAVEALKKRGPRARARLRRRHRQLLLRVELRRLQRAAVRQLRLHGRRLRPHPRQGRQPHRPGRVGERALHPDQRDVPRQAPPRGLRRRPQGAVGRLAACRSSTAATT